jgi:hypothetical protein
VSDHWALTLYERYVQLYGDPIEQPMTPRATDEDTQSPLPVNKNSTG